MKARIALVVLHTRHLEGVPERHVPLHGRRTKHQVRSGCATRLLDLPMCVGDLDGVSGKNVAASQLTTKADGMGGSSGADFHAGAAPARAAPPRGEFLRSQDLSVFALAAPERLGLCRCL